MRISDWSSDVCSSDLSSFEQLAATQSNIGRMVEAGVEVGIGMLGEDEARQVRLSTQNAGNLVALNDIPGANGLTWGEAFAAISSAPAKAVGLVGEIGSPQPGQRSDVVKTGMASWRERVVEYGTSL